jgi:hypothetical protein
MWRAGMTSWLLMTSGSIGLTSRGGLRPRFRAEHKPRAIVALAVECARVFFASLQEKGGVNRAACVGREDLDEQL